MNVVRVLLVGRCPRCNRSVTYHADETPPLCVGGCRDTRVGVVGAAPVAVKLPRLTPSSTTPGVGRGRSCCFSLRVVLFFAVLGSSCFF